MTPINDHPIERHTHWFKFTCERADLRSTIKVETFAWNGDPLPRTNCTRGGRFHRLACP